MPIGDLGIVKILKYFKGNPYVKRSATVAGAPITLNIHEYLEDNAHTGGVQNLSATADLLVSLSSDGDIFTDTVLVYPQITLDLEDEDVHSIIIDASANATPYQVVAH
jgi:hypothetical protein